MGGTYISKLQRAQVKGEEELMPFLHSIYYTHINKIRNGIVLFQRGLDMGTEVYQESISLFLSSTLIYNCQAAIPTRLVLRLQVILCLQ